MVVFLQKFPLPRILWDGLSHTRPRGHQRQAGAGTHMGIAIQTSQQRHRHIPLRSLRTLFFGQRAWNAVGRHHGRGEVRTLDLVRFDDCKPYGIPYEFSLQKHFGQAWRIIPAGKLYDTNTCAARSVLVPTMSPPDDVVSRRKKGCDEEAIQ